MKTKELVAFIVARHSIYLKRQESKRKPWTTDPILQKYRFCNVYRELDTVTEWLAREWRNPHRGDPDLWFAMSVARWINWPDTLDAIGWPLPYRARNVVAAINKRRASGDKVWTGAYMIGTQGNAMDKPLFIADKVLQPLWDDREHLRPRKGDTLATFAKRVISVKNQGSFMVGQMVADAKYADPILLEADDWYTWAVSGPGSRRGLNRVLDRDKDAPWKDATWLAELTKLRAEVNDSLPPWMNELHAQDLQNCLCEFDKYMRVALGEGRPRSLYPGAA